MSVARPSGRPRPREISQLQARRRAANRRRALLRLDVAIGVLVALVLLVATPGLAVAALLGLAMLVVCVVSLALERRSRRRLARVEDEDGDVA